MVTKEFRDALKLYPVPKHKLAWETGISPSQLSHLVNGHQHVEFGDERLLKIAKLITFPPERVFESTKTITRKTV